MQYANYSLAKRRTIDDGQHFEPVSRVHADITHTNTHTRDPFTLADQPAPHTAIESRKRVLSVADLYIQQWYNTVHSGRVVVAVVVVGGGVVR